MQGTLTYNHNRHNLRFDAGVTRTDIVSNNLVISGLVFLSMPDLLLGQSAAQNGSSYSNIYQSNDFPGPPYKAYFVWNP